MRIEPFKLSQKKKAELFLETGVSMSTIARWAHGKDMSTAVAKILAIAAEKLGLDVGK
jgi:transcriptional regulator with XRE-family HTH domain